MSSPKCSTGLHVANASVCQKHQNRPCFANFRLCVLEGSETLGLGMRRNNLATTKVLTAHFYIDNHCPKLFSDLIRVAIEAPPERMTGSHPHPAPRYPDTCLALEIGREWQLEIYGLRL